MNTPRNSAARSTDTSLSRHALRMLLDRNRLAGVMHILVGVVLGAVMSTVVPAWRGMVFAAGLGIVVALQLRLAARKARTEWSEPDYIATKKQFDALALSVGIMWGFAGLMLFPSGQPALQLFLTFVMGGMSLSAVATQGMSLRTCYVSIIPGMTPLGLRYLVEGGVTNWISGGLILVYVVVLVSLARKINDFMLQAFRLQIEKEGLLEDVRRQAQELDAARQVADEANLSKSRFLAQASHDLRQPLHAISLFVESLPDATSPAEHEEILNRVRQSLDVLTKLFDSLLDVTLLDTGGIEIRRQAFRPCDAIAEVERDFSLVAQACRVELRVVESQLVVESDPVLLRRMLQNLVSNAIRHSQGGRVLIGCRRRGDTLSIAVADNGPGIAEQDQARIFGEFTRLDAARMGAMATPGLGLGLSIVKRVAEALGLQVRLTSQPGRGSIFSIDGFRIADPEEANTHAAPAAPKDVVSGASVFVLDDDPETLAATELLLRRWGCRVQASKDWRDLASANPDVVICDYELSPGKTGLDVVKELEATPNRGPPVVMISGHTSRELRREADARGIPLLHKPIRPAQLRSALLNALVASEKAS